MLFRSRHEDRTGRGTRGYKVMDQPHAEVMQAHFCILYNTEEVQPYLEEHRQLLIELYPNKTAMQIETEQRKTFIAWFEKKSQAERESI